MIGIFAQAAPAGVVSGGWGYVTAAYVATWLFFVGYALSLALRARAAREELERAGPADVAAGSRRREGR